MEPESRIHSSSRSRRSSGGDMKKKGLHRKSSAYKDIKRSKQLFLAGVLVSLFWFLINIFKFYRSPLLEMVVKVMWLPMLIILFLIPIICLLFLLRKKFNPKSFYLYAIILCFITIIYVAAIS